MTTNNGSTKDQPDSTPDLDRHARLCVICRHPDRDHIDFDFVQWGRPETIVREYHLRSRKILYRHARATGLSLPPRSRNVRSALDHVIQRISDSAVNTVAAIQAVRIYAHINDSGAWVEPTRRFLIAKEIPVPEQVELILAPSLAASVRKHQKVWKRGPGTRAPGRPRARTASRSPPRTHPRERTSTNYCAAAKTPNSRSQRLCKMSRLETTPVVCFLTLTNDSIRTHVPIPANKIRTHFSGHQRQPASPQRAFLRRGAACCARILTSRRAPI